jgi:hypothetical protein
MVARETRTKSTQETDAVVAVPNVAEFATKLASLRDMQMPVREHGAPRDLEATLRAHQEWVASIADNAAPISGRRACLSGLDLRGVNLSRRDLRGADLSKANLEGAVLQGAKLLLTDFRGANLKGADLRGAEGADLSGAITE